MRKTLKEEPVKNNFKDKPEVYPEVLKLASIYQHKFHSPFEETLVPSRPKKKITLFSCSLLPIELVTRRKRQTSSAIAHSF